MSVRLTATTDRLRALNFTPALTIGAGAYSLGIGVKLKLDRNVRSEILLVGPGVSPDPDIGVRTAADGVTANLQFGAGSELGSGQALAVDTWYWLVVSRTAGGGRHIRVFADTTSTTPLVDVDGAVDSVSYTTFDSILIGDSGWGLVSADCEIENLKVHTGVSWTNSEARIEGQNYGIQTAGGVDRLCWKLQTVTADINGINEMGGAGPNLVNSGCVNGASTPAQLSSGPSVAAKGRYREQHLLMEV